MTSLSVVSSSGDLKQYSQADTDMMKALRCNLGLFGVIYEIELKVFPQQTVKVINDFEPTVYELFYTEGSLKNLVKSNDSVELYWFPLQSIGADVPLDPSTRNWDPCKDKTWVRKINRADDVPAPRVPETSLTEVPPVLEVSYSSCKLMYPKDETTYLTDAIHYLHKNMYSMSRVNFFVM